MELNFKIQVEYPCKYYFWYKMEGVLNEVFHPIMNGVNFGFDLTAGSQTITTEIDENSYLFGENKNIVVYYTSACKYPEETITSTFINNAVLDPSKIKTQVLTLLNTPDIRTKVTITCTAATTVAISGFLDMNNVIATDDLNPANYNVVFPAGSDVVLYMTAQEKAALVNLNIVGMTVEDGITPLHKEILDDTSVETEAPYLRQIFWDTENSGKFILSNNTGVHVILASSLATSLING